jgi:hypothetical protein
MFCPSLLHRSFTEDFPASTRMACWNEWYVTAAVWINMYTLPRTGVAALYVDTLLDGKRSQLLADQKISQNVQLFLIVLTKPLCSLGTSVQQLRAVAMDLDICS